METVYDWLTVAIFAGLVVLFLQRSTADGPPRDSMLQYLGASAGCAVANYFGNKAVGGGGILYHLIAVAIIVATIAYIHIALRPLDKTGS
ncbi:MAG: XrtV sorting system accessory protein [Pseudomonadota bacterium]